MPVEVPWSDSVRRYKRGTEDVARWLIRAGRACGLSIESSTSHNKKQLVSTEQFLRLAQAVARQEDMRIGVDRHLIATLKDVIELRKSVNEFCQGSIGKTDVHASSDATHAHFIGVLQEVLDALTSLQQTSESWTLPAATSRQSTTGAPHVASCADAAEHGRLEEDENSDRDEREALAPLRQQVIRHSRGRKNGKQKSRPKRKNLAAVDEFHLEVSTQELYSMLIYFFTDLDEVRIFLLRLWNDYADGKTTLVAAAVATDLATDAIRRQEREFLDTEVYLRGRLCTLGDAFANIHATQSPSEFRRIWRYEDENRNLDHWYLGELLFDYIYRAGQEEVAKGNETRARFQSGMYIFADWLGLPSFAWLDMFQARLRTELSPKAPAFVQPRAFAEPEHGPEALQLMERFAFNDKMIFYPLTFYGMAAQDHISRKPQPPRDAWTREMFGLVDVIRIDSARKAPERSTIQQHLAPSLVWATTVIFDIRWRIGPPQCTMAFKELQDYATAAKPTINRFIEWAAVNSIDADYTVRSLRDLLSIIERYIEQDLASTHVKLNPTAIEKDKAQLLFRRNPAYCGIILYWMKTLLYRLGIELANDTGILLHSVHIYNMAANVYDKRFTWPDLEYVITLHGEEHLFVGGRPDNVKQCNARFRLAMGQSATESSRDRHWRLLAASTTRSRELRESKLVAVGLVPRYHLKPLRLSPGDFDQSCDAASLLLHVARRQETHVGDRQVKDASHLTSLLETLRQTLDREWKDLNFDYLNLTMLCWDMLALLNTQLSVATFQRQGYADLYRERHAISELGPYIMTLAPLAFDRPNSLPQLLGANALNSLTAVEDFARQRGSEVSDAMTDALGRQRQLMHTQETPQEPEAVPRDTAPDNSRPKPKRANNKKKNQNRKTRQKELKGQNDDVSISIEGLQDTIPSANVHSQDGR
ncbi:hypothetical protein HII31_06962 [Pseudocercospora fuligena]|uniref:DUF6604 domain-containing protein n=1 Tax=Pseudocercospora fuligena TaxID=685502 RepID=A0A8H6RGK5_9PEZI|nr:hypothetical protein HII31_06962 [Pseudocercospora fuligena]